MRHILAAACIVALGSTVHAQSSTSASGSQSSSTVGVQSSAQSIVYGDTYNSNGRLQTEYSGSYDINNVPGGMPGPGFSSGHPCAYAAVSGGLVVIGGGASLGGQRIDDACLLAQIGEQGAAVAMIAARNEEACMALRNGGRISPKSLCNARERRQQAKASASAATPAAAPATSTRPVARPVAQQVCEQKNGKLRFSVDDTFANRASARANCLRTLG